MGDYIYVVQLDIPAEHEDDFNTIYDEDHIPKLMQVPGMNGCTRYKLESIDVGDMPRYVAIYDMDSADLPASDTFRAASDAGEWINKVRPYTQNRRRAVFKKIT